jgi:hypothetical protein
MTLSGIQEEFFNGNAVPWLRVVPKYGFENAQFIRGCKAQV